MIRTIEEKELPTILPGYMLDAAFPDFVEYGRTGREDLEILAKLCQSVEAKTFFEFGTWEGKTVKILSHYFDRIYTIDIPIEDIKNINDIPEIQRDELRTKEWIGKFCCDLPNVVQLYGDTSLPQVVDSIRSSIDGQIDAVFVDANHYYSYVLCDSLTALRIARRIIIWHDVYHGPVPDVTAALEILPFVVYHIEGSHIGFYLP